jgi:hypothetical protein
MLTRELLKVYNEQFHNFFSSPNIISLIKSKRIKWARHVARIGEEENACKILVGKPEGNGPLGRPRPWGG